MKKNYNIKIVIAILTLTCVISLDSSICFSFLIAGRYNCAGGGDCTLTSNYTEFQTCANAVFTKGGANLSVLACGSQGDCPIGGIICKYEPPFFIHVDGTYSKSSEKGTFKVIGQLVDFSESKIRGIGKISDTGNQITFAFKNPYSTVPGDEIRVQSYKLVSGTEEGLVTGTGSGTGTKTLKPPVEVTFNGGPKGLGFIDPEKGELATFNFTAQTTGKVNVKVFNPQGKEITNGSVDVTAGQATGFTWDGRIKDGNDPVPSGIYIIRIEGPDFKETKKIAVVK